MQNFRKLRVWAKAHALAIEIRRATQSFPTRDYQSLRSQLVRAAESVVLNIIEGCGSSSQKEFARFLDMSSKSTTEVEGGLLLARDYGIMDPDQWRRLARQTVEVRRMVYGLRTKVLADQTVQPAVTRKRVARGAQRTASAPVEDPSTSASLESE
jgi:four helix bundle protein